MFKNGNKMKIDRKINNTTMTTNHVRRLSHTFFLVEDEEKSVCFIQFVRYSLCVFFLVSLNSLFLCISNRSVFTHSMSFVFDRFLLLVLVLFLHTNRVLLLSLLLHYYHRVECVNFNQWKLLFHCH